MRQDFVGQVGQVFPKMKLSEFFEQVKIKQSQSSRLKSYPSLYFKRVRKMTKLSMTKFDQEDIDIDIKSN